MHSSSQLIGRPSSLAVGGLLSCPKVFQRRIRTFDHYGPEDIALLLPCRMSSIETIVATLLDIGGPTNVARIKTSLG